MKTSKSLLSVVAAVAMLSTIASAATYDAFSDFSTNANPDGVWTFGRATLANGGTFTAFDDFVTVVINEQTWRDNEHISAGAPAVWRNTEISTLNFHPGPGGGLDEFTIIRFTAPVAGQFTYDAQFTSIDSGTKSLFIYHESTLLYTTTLGGSASASDTDTLLLAFGDTLDVVVGNYDGYFSDSTRVGFTVQAIPEPASLASLLGASAGIALFRRRRR